MNDVCTKLELQCFSEREFKFLKEYVLVLKPLSRGLDILQGEDNCFFGTLLPTLETIIKKVIALQPDLSYMTCGLAGAIKDSIRRRFEQVLQSNSAILAAVTSPKFKLKWVESQDTKDLYKQMLLQEMRSLAAGIEVAVVQDSQDEMAESTRSKKDDFYDFKSDDESAPESNVDMEANDYLVNARSIDNLHKYPLVKKLFLLYNTALPSSAPVERLFSLGGLVLSAKRNRLVDQRFEKLLLMRYNKDYLDI